MTSQHYLCFTDSKMFRSKASILKIVMIIQIVSFVSCEKIIKADLNRSVAQFVKARDDLEKIVKNFEFQQSSVHSIGDQFTAIRKDLEANSESTCNPLNAEIEELENRATSIENNIAFSVKIIKNQAVKIIDDLIKIMRIDSDFSALDERIFIAKLRRSVGQLSKARNDLEKVVKNLKLDQTTIQPLRGSLKRPPFSHILPSTLDGGIQSDIDGLVQNITSTTTQRLSEDQQNMTEYQMDMIKDALTDIALNSELSSSLIQQTIEALNIFPIGD